MNDDEQPEEYQPPIGTAGLACFGCLAAVYLATIPFIGFLDRWRVEWLLYIFVPVSVVFFILGGSSWHRELPCVTRTFSMLLTACIIYLVVLLVGIFAVVLASFIFAGNMVAG